MRPRALAWESLPAELSTAMDWYTLLNMRAIYTAIIYVQLTQIILFMPHTYTKEMQPHQEAEVGRARLWRLFVQPSTAALIAAGRMCHLLAFEDD
jgi:hypothetical protein